MNFDPSLTHERFIPPTGPSGPVSEAEALYVRTLIEHAEQRGKIPVLTETRTLGRVAGLKEAAPGLHVVLYRNLYQQWCSYTEQAVGDNSYFLDMTAKVASFGRHDPVIRDILAMFPVEVASPTDVNTFYLFVFLHIHLYVHAAAAADHVIDVNRLSDDASYRSEIEEIFAGQGVEVDFSDARSSTAFSLLSFPDQDEMLEQVKIISDTIIARSPSGRGRDIANKIVAEFIEEFERSEFYCRRMRTFLLSTRRDTEDVRKQIVDLQSEQNRFGAEKDEAVAAAEAARRQCADVQAERDRALAEAGEAIAALENTRQQIASLSSEHDRLQGEKDEALVAAEGARRQCADVQAERDRALAETGEAIAAVEETRQQMAILRSEHDRLQGEKDEALVAAETARRQCAEVQAERDRALAEGREAIAAFENTRQQIASLSSEHDRLQGEKDAAARAAEEARREADTLGIEREAAVRARDAVASERHRLGQELASLSSIRDQLTTGREAALAAAAKAEGDRQLVAGRYDALLHWSIAYHDATAASASWRLTKPLRWLGLGRPKRPEKPDFL